MRAAVILISDRHQDIYLPEPRHSVTHAAQEAADRFLLNHFHSFCSLLYGRPLLSFVGKLKLPIK